jgi:hypothetical protein
MCMKHIISILEPAAAFLAVVVSIVGCLIGGLALPLIGAGLGALSLLIRMRSALVKQA